MRPKHTSVAFLMEMLWVCGFFVISACIFLLVFVKADRMSLDTQNLNQAVLYTENAVEDTLANYTNDFDFSDSLTVFYDKEWTPMDSSSQDAAFQITVSASIEDRLLNVTAAAAHKNGDSIYSLSGARYLPE